MLKRSTFLAASLLAMALAGCAGAPPAPDKRASETSTYGIDCPACFLLIECMRSGLGEDVRQQGVIHCEHCCETLTFTTTPDGQIWVATPGMPQPMPLQACAPAPAR